jgi:hypothetical protein
MSKSRIGRRRSAAIAGAAIMAASLGFAALTPAVAASGGTEKVTEMNVVRQAENTPPTAPWVLYTRAGTPPTSGQFVTGPATPPAGTGSLQLSTALGSEKVTLFNFDHVGTALADVEDIAYSTYRQEGQAQQVAALNLQIDYNGAAAGGFSTLVFEPVYNTDQGPVVDDTWQSWDADGSGRWWSTRAINGTCAFDCFTEWDDIVAANPDATIVGGVGVNQGSGNPGLISNVDAFTFNDITYDFEATNSKDDCKNGGWAGFANPTFKNQGACVSYMEHESH